MKIKFCGIRRLEDVAFCNELQPEYLGMILSAGFRRTISPETAEQLVKAKSRSIAAVGVFVNETPEHIAQVLKQVPLDVIQLHGSETAEIISGVRWRTGLPVRLHSKRIHYSFIYLFLHQNTAKTPAKAEVLTYSVISLRQIKQNCV